jgi:hypothetical protein
MTAILRQRAAQELGAVHWRVELEWPGEPGGTPRAATGPRTMSARSADAASPPARVVTMAAPTAAARERWSVVLALDRPVRPGSVAVYEVGGEDRGGWAARVELGGALEEPGPASTAHGDETPQGGVDYRARDFEALRDMFLGLIADQVPGGLVGHPVAQSTAIVELLAYLGDGLSYQQDALATEAYLATARHRKSAARHAALLDYPVFEGRTARAWVRIEVDKATRLPRGTRLVTRSGSAGPRMDDAGLARAVTGGALVFETLQDAELEAGARRLALAGERHAGGLLAAGATRATVRGPRDDLVPGTFVLLEPAPPGPPGIGHVVRLAAVRDAGHAAGSPLTELEWPAADALPAATPLTGIPLCVRLGNLILAEHGTWQAWAPLPAPGRSRSYQPGLPHRHTSFTTGVPAASASAAEMLVAVDAVPAPAVRLREGVGHGWREWQLRPSLFESGPLAPHFVVEVGDDAEATLGFGDNVNGARPAPETRFEVRQRVGCGTGGNVGPGAIAHVVTGDARITGVSNPDIACGGADPETLSSIQLNAPVAFRTTDRVVIESDYAEQALLVAGVTDAAAALRSTGSWPIAVVHIHGGDWSSADGALLARVRDRLEARQPAGVDLRVLPAVPMPIDVRLAVSADDGWDMASVAAGIDDAIRRAFLRPGRFGLGDALHRSDLVTVVATAPGVVDVTVERFGWYRERFREAPAGTLLPPFGHVLRVDNDVARPDHGSIAYEIGRAA